MFVLVLCQEDCRHFIPSSKTVHPFHGPRLGKKLVHTLPKAWGQWDKKMPITVRLVVFCLRVENQLLIIDHHRVAIPLPRLFSFNR